MKIEEIILDNIQQKTNLPKSRVIKDTILEMLNRGELSDGAPLPSHQKLARKCSISPTTVAKAYDMLKKEGIIASVFGQGVYIDRQQQNYQYKVFLLFDELNMFKEDLYSTFVRKLENKAKIDIFFHHFNKTLFNNLLEEARGKYTHYIVMPLTQSPHDSEWLSVLNKKRTLVLDHLPPAVDCNYVSQDLNEGTYSALSSITENISRYTRFNYIFPPKEIEEAGSLIEKGFLKFCSQAGISHNVIHGFTSESLKQGEAYLVARESDLVNLVNTAVEQGMKPGVDIGIASYNDSELKKAIEGGITVISTDFREMGEKAADFILSGDKTVREMIPAKAVLRNSL